MDARSVVESALRAMIAQDIREHMRWIDDDVTLESVVAPPLTAKLRYLKECSPLLAPGSGIRLSDYEITRVRQPTPGEDWVDAILTIDAPDDGRLFPTSSVKYLSQRSEASYGVRNGRIVHVTTRSLPQPLNLSLA